MATVNFQKATVTITSAQLLGLNGTPVSIVGAPGAGKFNYVLSAIYTYNAGPIAYAGLNVGSAGVGVYYGNTGWNADGIVSPEVDLTSSPLVVGSGTAGPAGYPPSVLDNQPLNVQSQSAITGGNGTLSVTVVYTCLDV